MEERTADTDGSSASADGRIEGADASLVRGDGGTVGTGKRFICTDQSFIHASGKIIRIKDYFLKNIL